MQTIVNHISQDRNDNGLSGPDCPHCGKAQRPSISALVVADVTDDGATIASGSDMNWDDQRPTACRECGRDGPLAGFRSGELPPDPEGRNDDRAMWATTALSAFMTETGTDSGSAVTDLLCDLMHLADRAGSDFDADLARARMHYACETDARLDEYPCSNPSERNPA